MFFLIGGKENFSISLKHNYISDMLIAVQKTWN